MDRPTLDTYDAAGHSDASACLAGFDAMDERETYTYMTARELVNGEAW